MRKSSLIIAVAGGAVVGGVTSIAALFFPAAALPAGLGCATALLLACAHHWKANHAEHAQRQAMEVAELRALVALQETAFAAPLPWSAWALPPRALTDVLVTIQRSLATSIVECGSGVSTLHIARLLRALGRGHLTSLEQDPDWAAFVREILKQNQLDTWATVVEAPLVEQTYLEHTIEWYDVPPSAAPATIDLLVVDGPRGVQGKLARLGAVPHFWPKLSASVTIYLDDADRPEERAIAELLCARFPLAAVRVPTERGLIKLTRLDPEHPNATG